MHGRVTSAESAICPSRHREAVSSHGTRRPEGKYVTRLSEHSHKCQFCKNTYARFDPAKKTPDRCLQSLQTQSGRGGIHRRLRLDGPEQTRERGGRQRQTRNSQKQRGKQCTWGGSASQKDDPTKPHTHTRNNGACTEEGSEEDGRTDPQTQLGEDKRDDATKQ